MPRKLSCPLTKLAHALLRLEIGQRARQVAGRSPMVEFIAQRLGDNGANEEEGFGYFLRLFQL